MFVPLKQKLTLKIEKFDQLNDDDFRFKREYVAMPHRLEGIGVRATTKQFKHGAALCMSKQLRESD